jgi:DNA-binding NarL/FixJ family response regulator
MVPRHHIRNVLTPRQRELLTLRRHHGLSTREIAARLGSTPGAISQQLVVASADEAALRGIGKNPWAS